MNVKIYGYGQIKLSKGEIVKVDLDMVDFLNQWKWHLSSKGYAVRKPGKNHIFMHRIINKTPDGFQTDHINWDKLDNRKINLRTVTNQMNQFNKPIQKNNKSGVSGVSWCNAKRKWIAQICLNNKPICLGGFLKIEDAINIRNLAKEKYYVIHS
jgi:hypothetical protein